MNSVNPNKLVAEIMAFCSNVRVQLNQVKSVRESENHNLKNRKYFLYYNPYERKIDNNTLFKLYIVIRLNIIENYDPQ